jgi:flagellar FliL protein
MSASKSEKKEEAKEEKKEAAPEAAEGEEGAEKPVKGKRKLIIIIAAVVLLIAIGAGVFLSGVLGGGDKEAHKDKEKATEEQAVDEHGNPIIAKPAYYDLPPFLVNLSTGTGKTSFLKMSVTLELKDEASKAVVDANKPRILDAFNAYLRELRASDLAGSAGIYRLREELIARINSTVKEGLVKDILFSEIIIQ